MRMETIWLTNSVIMVIVFGMIDLNLLAGFIAGALIGFAITSVMKVFGYKFNESVSSYSSRNNSYSSSSCDWDF